MIWIPSVLPQRRLGAPQAGRGAAPGVSWISLDSLVANVLSQWVTRDSGAKKIPPSPVPLRTRRSARVLIESAGEPIVLMTEA